jgi:hypothetical protein
MRRRQERREPQVTSMTYWQRVRYNLRSTRHTQLTWLGFALFFMALAALYSLFAILAQPTFGAAQSAAAGHTIHGGG